MYYHGKEGITDFRTYDDLYIAVSEFTILTDKTNDEIVFKTRIANEAKTGANGYSFAGVNGFWDDLNNMIEALWCRHLNGKFNF